MALQDIIKKVDALKAELAKLKPLKPKDDELLRKKFLLEWNYNSNHIEGNTLTYRQTELLLIFDKAIGDSTGRDILEMTAHNVAIEMVEELAKDKERPLNETFIKSLNQTILVRPFWKEAETEDGQETRKLIKIGEYKDTPNSVRLTTGKKFNYASPEETPAKMGDLMQFYKSHTEKNDVHPLWLAAMMHYSFVVIHPFDDGNGRIARLLMNYILLKNDFPPVIIKSKDKTGYRMALNKADTGDKDAFVEYIGNQLIWSLEISIIAASGGNIEEEDDYEKEISIWKKQLKNVPANVLPKSDDQIYDLYQVSFKPLFESFIEKMKKFDDLFASKDVHGYVNSGNKEHLGLEYIDSQFQKWENQPSVFLKAGELPPPSPTLPPFNNIFIKIDFNGFKNDGTNVFGQYNELKIEFLPFLYTISFNNQKLRENHYSVFLNEDELRDIVSNCVKTTFSQIKSKVKNQ